MIFQHVGHEPLGTLNPMLKAAGFRIRYVNFARHPHFVPNLDGYSGLIILGGPMGVYEAHQFPHLNVEMKLIEEALKRDIPVLGICLGSQLIASVLGAQVRKAPDWELGWYDVKRTEHAAEDSLFRDFGASEKIFQMHQDTFDIPSGSAHLMHTELCPGQAFRYGEKVYGLQFHLEADRAMILRWLERDENRKLILESGGRFSAERLQQDTEAHISRQLELSREAFGRFIALFNLPERPILLGSEHGKPSKLGE